MKAIKCSVVVIIAIASFITLPTVSEAGLYGYLVGEVAVKTVVLGPSGSVNSITLQVNSFDGNEWAVTCMRANANLGLCDPVLTGDVIATEGNIIPTSSPSKNCGRLSPNRMTIQPPSYAGLYGLYGYVVGAVIGKKVDLGPSGNVNQITITVNSLDGNSWPVVCRRAVANLGLCDPVQLGHIIASDGPMLPFAPPVNGCGWITPSTMHVFP